ncbi:MAG TPA: hypothetical protein VFS43_24535 [Polyangiaceae bacterium]|nr:hypothetical protein [Polyangiaceae bacterium]
MAAPPEEPREERPEATAGEVGREAAAGEEARARAPGEEARAGAADEEARAGATGDGRAGAAADGGRVTGAGVARREAALAPARSRLGGAVPSRSRRRLAGLLLAGGLVASGLLLAEWAPVDQEITLRLGGERARLRSLDVTLLDGQGETLGASRWDFSSRAAPPSVSLRLRAPRGDGVVWVSASSEGGDPLVREHRVKLDGSPLTIPLRLGEAGER